MDGLIFANCRLIILIRERSNAYRIDFASRDIVGWAARHWCLAGAVVGVAVARAWTAGAWAAFASDAACHPPGT